MLHSLFVRLPPSLLPPNPGHEQMDGLTLVSVEMTSIQW